MPLAIDPSVPAEPRPRRTGRGGRRTAEGEARDEVRGAGPEALVPHPAPASEPATDPSAEVAPAPPELAMLVTTYLNHLGVERGLARNSLAAYRRDLARYLEYLATTGHTDLAGIGEAEVAAFVASLRTGTAGHPPLAEASVARMLAAVRGLHRFAAAEGLVTQDAARPVRAPRQQRRLPKSVSVSDIERMLHAAAMPGTPLALRDVALLELLYATGGRITEVVSLDVDDLERTPAPAPALGSADLGSAAAPADAERVAVLLRGKGGTHRRVPVGRAAVAAVDAYLVRARPGLVAAGPGSHALLLNARGGRLSRQSAWAVIQQIVDRAGLSGHVSPHTLRHSFATHLLDGGADVRVVQELLGHASVATTQIYTLVTVDHLREVYAESHPRARATPPRPRAAGGR